MPSRHLEDHVSRLEETRLLSVPNALCHKAAAVG
jgi:hypothetical protein